MNATASSTIATRSRVAANFHALSAVGAYTPVTPGPRLPVFGRSDVVAAILHVLEGPDTGRLFSLAADLVTIGRNAENTIVLNDVGVSGVHPKIVRNEQGKFTIHDNASTNGTFLNGREQRASDLKHGDRITIGSTTFAFELRRRSRT